MVLAKLFLAMAALALANGSPTIKSSFWKDISLGSTIEEMRSLCDNDDAIACIKFKAMQFFEQIFQRDSYKLSDAVEINRNSYQSNEVSGRTDSGLEDKIGDYVKSHDVTFKLPLVDTKVTVDGRNLDQDELNLKLSFGDSTDVQEARKSKLKKIFIPILVFILLKAMTLIPLALGVLGLKAWNALQLSFFSFIVSVALAVFQLCKKIATDNNHPQISAHGGWDTSAYSSHYVARSLDATSNAAAQELAYSGYSQ